MAESGLDQEAHAAQAAALADWLAGRIANEYYDKVPERQISDTAVQRVLQSKVSGVGRYRHTRDQPRYEFWHPESEILVVWQPAEQTLHSQIKTCFRRARIEPYMLRQEAAACLRAPGKRDQRL
ncbi:MAG: hypothetical protein COZ06_28425 [Armatimonadetes bacterium CG_4_10_14_3_um_filter_66_18]|nr:hypothetical protein [Armatimonadota bacterium]OIO95572.1 MAG: hypothetical protein AUJ96_26500 [Armatimonadetes bacterium CG2_30_66_41]PIU95122.1 MAG: hypothetical protein COS65_04070 [Armatimonadetes bacterium CG06_land_8_20_14_3_00_66_21]PIX41429.1 MAG: hypothetical protein COZ57_23370 [Armatimonadetes bacterium CG_4_8_14_3_um_filter_66_20]PIY40202.1 MAG: hypothetical protein COZ06_28425 [Armatimonadetes bacterium CG_4_10_14_3_um_filter_66_18]PIZ30258.1 MAG: hypothetical protein COY42_34